MNSTSQSLQMTSSLNQLDPMMQSKQFSIFCHKHPGNVITHGCIEYNCENNSIMCEQCIADDQGHTEQHRQSIMAFSDYLHHIASEIGRLAAPNSSFLHKNIQVILQNEAYYHNNFENLLNQQRQLLYKNLDEIGSLVMHHLERVKHLAEHYFQKQFETYRLNMLYFKQQYKGYNPDETYTKYSDYRNIKQKILVKSPIQAYHFLSNLRKSANLEGQVLSNLNYLAESIANWNEKYPLIDQIMYDKHMKKVVQVVQDLEADIQLNLKDAPNLDIGSVIEANQNLISYNKKSVRINSYRLFDMLKFNFQVVATNSTLHLNSATAIVSLAEDVVATSSYDRTVKIWRLQDGVMMKQLHDRNSITCLCVFKYSNDKNRENFYYNEDDLQYLQNQISENPSKSMSNLGLFLLTGGLDKIIKVWDFDFLPDPSVHVNKAYTELQGHAGWVTQIISLEDEQNVVSGDDTGELIIWSVFKSQQVFRLSFAFESMVMTISLIEKQKRFAASSGDILKIWLLDYRSDGTKSLHSFNPQLVDCCLERTFNLKTPIYCMSIPRSFKNIIIVGSKNGVLKYIDLNKSKMVTINTDHKDMIGDMILIEKLKLSEQDFDYFHKNINFVFIGTKKLGLYNGYGNILEEAVAANAEDFCTSSILPNRNLTLLKVHKRAKTSFIRLAAISQFQSEFYSYQSSRVSLIHIKADFLDYL
ncbi:hypothetical protein ABPG73_015248 [Tetrahymena malaccensis]